MNSWVVKRLYAGALRLSLGAGVLAVGTGLLGCGSAKDSLILVGGEPIDAAAIDKDPLSVLPSGVLMLAYLDAATLFKSSLGGEVDTLVGQLVPIGRESNFVASRDVTRIYGGVYAMQGADFCAVVQGNFDAEAIRRAADARATTMLGVPLVKSRYAGNDMYTAGNIGFVPLTPRTALAGNETGMRRALDRIQRGKLSRSMPPWMVQLTETQGAAFALAGDLSGQAAVASAAQQVPFLAGLKYVRVLGNFLSPGVNYAGTLTYGDPQTAASGAQALRNVEQIARVASLLTSWGLGSAPQMQVAQHQSEVAFTLPLNDTMARMLLRQGAEVLKNVAVQR
ncbi:hypothetical protein [Chondromyces crocatus]|nr:hypothetical protein [Chondromyces crocatus]